VLSHPRIPCHDASSPMEYPRRHDRLGDEQARRAVDLAAVLSSCRNHVEPCLPVLADCAKPLPEKSHRIKAEHIDTLLPEQNQDRQSIGEFRHKVIHPRPASPQLASYPPACFARRISESADLESEYILVVSLPCPAFWPTLSSGDQNEVRHTRTRACPNSSTTGRNG